MKSTASARWDGSVKDGPGKLTAKSGLFTDAPYSVKARFEGDAPGTTPEELLAAAHSGCFTMFLGVSLMRAGITPKSIETDATVEVVMGSAGASITESALSCRVDVPGGDSAKIRELAEGAKTGCPVSKALSIPITLSVSVKT